MINTDQEAQKASENHVRLDSPPNKNLDEKMALLLNEKNHYQQVSQFYHELYESEYKRSKNKETSHKLCCCFDCLKKTTYYVFFCLYEFCQWNKKSDEDVVEV